MEIPTPAQISQLSADQLDRVLESLRVLGSQVKAVEVILLREVDRRQIPLGDGMRTLEDWVIGRMDVNRSTARNLVAVAKADSAQLDGMLTEFGVSFDRVSLLAGAGSNDPREDLDLIGLRQHLPVEHRSRPATSNPNSTAASSPSNRHSTSPHGDCGANCRRWRERSSPTRSTPSPTNSPTLRPGTVSPGKPAGPTPPQSSVSANPRTTVRTPRFPHPQW